LDLDHQAPSSAVALVGVRSNRCGRSATLRVSSCSARSLAGEVAGIQARDRHRTLHGLLGRGCQPDLHPLRLVRAPGHGPLTSRRGCHRDLDSTLVQGKAA